jgi:hypothetical protein
MTVDAPGNGPSAAITAVKEDGRWFVSPVGTVLDLVDQAIAGVAQREIYELLNVPELLPPDGTLTLGTPVTLPATTFGSAVYSFDGHQGEKLLGLATSSVKDDLGFAAEVRVFGPDGKEVANADGLLEGVPFELPADGAYKFVMQPFLGGDVTVTIWDEANAPDAAKHPPAPSGFGECPDTGAVNACALPGFPLPSSSSSATTSTSVPGA